MPQKDILGYPSRYVLESVTLTNMSGDTINITEIVVSIAYTEDIFSPCVYGACVISDANDIHQFLPICGEETLEIRYKSSPEDDEVIKKFAVYSAADKKTTSNINEQYTLNFCSTELISNIQSKVSKAYTNKKTQEIATDIFSVLETDKTLTCDETLESHHIIIPNLTPFDAIQYLTSISMSPVSAGSLYTFYEDRDGFHFSNIEVLMEKETITETPISVRMQNIKSESEQLFPSTSFASLHIHTSAKHIINNSLDGVFSNTVLSYDPLTKSFDTNTYNYDTDFDRTISLDKFRLTSQNYITPNSQQRISVVPTKSHRRQSRYYNSRSNGQLYPLTPTIVSNRTAQLGQLETIKVSGSLYGMTRATAGKTISIDVPSHTQIENKKNEPTHKYLSGKYLIKSCTHILSLETYMVNVVLMKDTLYSELETDID